MEGANRCNEIIQGQRCIGTIHRHKDTCSCHIHPPCSACVDSYMYCDTCDWDDREVIVPTMLKGFDIKLGQTYDETKEFSLAVTDDMLSKPKKEPELLFRTTINIKSFGNWDRYSFLYSNKKHIFNQLKDEEIWEINKYWDNIFDYVVSGKLTYDRATTIEEGIPTSIYATYDVRVKRFKKDKFIDIDINDHMKFTFNEWLTIIKNRKDGN